ncbi:MAG: hypothetical protein KatS3mg081_0595 [Gemmatimonadales bacterium]|nr:MAG: hypothetical protein KatS3mg081_0595 [Gemmatimonadales bacterium]
MSRKRSASHWLEPDPSWHPEVREFFSRVAAHWDLAQRPDAVALLRTACDAKNRALEAEALLRKEGLVLRTAKGTTRLHPAAKIARENAALFVSALREMGLE